MGKGTHALEHESHVLGVQTTQAQWHKGTSCPRLGPRFVYHVIVVIVFVFPGETFICRFHRCFLPKVAKGFSLWLYD